MWRTKLSPHLSNLALAESARFASTLLQDMASTGVSMFFKCLCIVIFFFSNTNVPFLHWCSRGPSNTFGAAPCITGATSLRQERSMVALFAFGIGNLVLANSRLHYEYIVLQWVQCFALKSLNSCTGLALPLYTMQTKAVSHQVVYIVCFQCLPFCVQIAKPDLQTSPSSPKCSCTLRKPQKS